MANVLIVEDQERVRDVVSRVLERQGHQVHWLPSPGPDLYEQDFEALDLLIIDLAMPTRGEEAIYTLRSSGVKIPILVLSGFVSDADEVPLKALGADKVLSKPCPSDVLMSTVAEMIGR